MSINLKDQIIQLRSEGKTYEQIQIKLNCSLSTICYHLKPDEKTKNVNRRNKNRYRLKEKYRQSLGGKCLICGYNKCQNALQFHHLDPKTKKFTVSDAFSRKSYPREQIDEEVKKCILVCANCHFEIHSGITNIEKLAPEAGSAPATSKLTVSRSTN